MATENQLRYWRLLKGKSHGHRTNNGLPAWNRGKLLPMMWDENHHAYKGDKVSYRNLHRWVERRLGKPMACDECGISGSIKGKKRPYHWANISGIYQRVITDWRRLCTKCHGAFDANRAKA